MGKSEQTRQLVRDTALRLLRERGYEATTMRLIATEAGVATGNAYYYFPSKDHLIQELYAEIQAEHATAATAVLTEDQDLTTRLRATMHAGIDVFGRYQDFGRDFVSVAIRPGSPASPFSAESGPSRAASQRIFSDVVTGARPAVPAHLAGPLPELLWLTWLGVTLFWVNDTSADAARTRRLIDGAVPLLGRLVRLSRLPLVRRVVADVLHVVEDVRR